MKAPIIRTAVALLLCFPLIVNAENSTKSGGYTIHHNAINASTLTPDIANQYGIVRSKYRGMLNVSIIKDEPGTTGTASTGRIVVRSTNLIGQTNDIAMKKVEEGDAIYYLGQFPITDQERITFRMEITPTGSEKALRAEFTQQFFID